MINSLSIVIPVRNEQEYLPKCLNAISESARNITDLDLEIVVVLNRSTDNSEQIASAAGCVLVHEDSKNLSKIRNAGVRKAKGEFVATIDADSFMSNTMIPDILTRLNRADVIGGGVLMKPERWSIGIALTGIMMALPLSLWHGLISAGLFYFRKKDFFAIGGFNENMYSAEDVDFAVRLKNYGKAKSQKFSTIFSSHIVTSCRKFDRFGDWYYIRTPLVTWRLLKGLDIKTADRYWYDFNDR